MEIVTDTLTNKLLVKLLKVQNYFAELIVTLSVQEVNEKPVIDEETGKPSFRVTAAINEKGTLIVNKYFMEWILEKEKEGKTPKKSSLAVFIHELLHILHGDLELLAERIKCTPEEMRSFVALRLNIAADIAINQQLPWVSPVTLSAEDKKNLLEKKPLTKETQEKIRETPFILFPEYFGFPKGLTTLEYLDLLPKDQKGISNLLASIGAKEGDLSKMNPFQSEFVAKTISESIRQKLKELSQEAHRRGTMPALLQKALEKIIEAEKKPWNLILRKYVKSAILGPRELQWKRPCRRTSSFPGRSAKKRHRILLAIDTSGSTLSYRERFLAEMKIIYDQTKADIDVVECDAKVAPNMPYKFKGQEIRSMTGGGGTAFLPVFKWVRDKYKKKIDVLVFLTDGYGEDPNKPSYVNYPVIWVTTGRDPANWGSIIKMDAE